MREITGALAEQHAELRTLLDGLGPAQWNAPTRCPGWSVADVVLHLAQTDEIALGSLRGRMPAAMAEVGWPTSAEDPPADVDEAAARAVARQRGSDPGEVARRWVRAADAQCAEFAAADPRRRVPWVNGDLPVRTLATTRLAETWIHTGDVAAAVGIEMQPSARLWHIARLAWRTLPYAFARSGRSLSGPVALELLAPDGSTWSFIDGDPVTVVRGSAESFCQVAARRLPGPGSGLDATGADAVAVLELVRTFA